VSLFGGFLQLVKRFDIAVAPEGRQKMAEQMKDSRIPPEACNMEEMLLGGLVTQLRSIPIGFRSEDWIAQNFRELADLQKRAVLAQLTQNLEAIKIAALESLKPQTCGQQIKFSAGSLLSGFKDSMERGA
jgi:hypothetical protein